MKTYNTIKEVKKDVVNNILKINDNITFNCDVVLPDISIKARDIDAKNITAENIKAKKIQYYTYCISYNNIVCTSIQGTRKNCFHKCLDGKLIIKE